MDEEKKYRIGELAEEFGVTLRTLRFYEEKGLLHPEREGTTRLFSRRDRARLKLALLGQKLGFSLSEAKRIIDAYDEPNGRRCQLEMALGDLREHRELLLQDLQEAKDALALMDHTLKQVRDALKVERSETGRRTCPGSVRAASIRLVRS